MDHLDLQDLCAEFGNVDESRLITDRETGRSRGFGFVTMSSEKEAEDVVAQLNGQDVDGRVLRVNIATSNKDGVAAAAAIKYNRCKRTTKEKKTKTESVCVCKER